jgi:hypothetical protein
MAKPKYKIGQHAKDIVSGYEGKIMALTYTDIPIVISDDGIPNRKKLEQELNEIIENENKLINKK